MKSTLIAASIAAMTLSAGALAQDERPITPDTVFRDRPGCPEMLVLPAGSFSRGSSPEEKLWAASRGGSKEAVADEAHSAPAGALSAGPSRRSQPR